MNQNITANDEISFLMNKSGSNIHVLRTIGTTFIKLISKYMANLFYYRVDILILIVYY